MHRTHDLAARNIAHTAGMRAALEPADPPDVPVEYGNGALAEAWTAGYRSVSTALCNQRPGVMEAAATIEKKPRERKAKAQAKAPVSGPMPPKAHTRPTMMAVLEEQLSGR